MADRIRSGESHVCGIMDPFLVLIYARRVRHRSLPPESHKFKAYVSVGVSVVGVAFWFCREESGPSFEQARRGLIIQL